VDRSEFDVGVAANAEVGAGGGRFDFDIAHGAGIGSGAQRMLGVALDFDRWEVCLAQGVNEGGDRAVAGSLECHGLAVEEEVGFDCDLLAALNGPESAKADGASAEDVGFQEKFVDFLGLELGAFFVRDRVDDATEFLLEHFRKLVAEFRLEEVCDAAFAGLGIDSNDRFIATSDIGGIDGNVERIPRIAFGLVGPGFLDGILMRTAEGRESKVAGVRVAGMNLHAGAALVHLADGIEAAEVEVRVDAVGVEIECDCDDIQVARALSDSEERALDPVGSSEEGQFGGGSARATVVVGVQRENREGASCQVAGHPLDLVGVDVWRGVFDCGGEVENDFILRSRLPDVRDGFANLQGKIEFRAREAFGRVFETDARAFGHQWLHFFLQKRNRMRGDGDNLLAGRVEDIFTLLRRGRVVEVENNAACAAQGLKRPEDEVFAALAEDLNRDIRRDQFLLDKAATEIEFDLGSGGKTNFDFLETDADEHLEILELLLYAHRLREGLVAVSEIHAAPDGSGGEATVWPLAVGEVDSWKRPVFGDRRLLHEYFYLSTARSAAPSFQKAGGLTQ